MKLYILTEGVYSDYRVIGIYDNQDDYEVAERLIGGGNSVKTMELNAMPCDRPEGLYPFCVNMDRGGNVHEIEETTWQYLNKENDSYGWSATNCANGAIDFYMWARDEDHARKIAGDRRIRLLAENQWISDINDWYEEETKGNLITFL